MKKILLSMFFAVAVLLSSNAQGGKQLPTAKEMTTYVSTNLKLDATTTASLEKILTDSESKLKAIQAGKGTDEQKIALAKAQLAVADGQVKKLLGDAKYAEYQALIKKPGGNQGAQWGTPGGNPNGTGNGNNGSGPGTASGDLNVTGRKWRDRKVPFNNTNKEGKVVVQIKVDKNGNIIYVKGGVAGSTTTDAYLISQAEQAARNSKLTESAATAEEQFGTITYRFSNTQ